MRLTVRLVAAGRFAAAAGLLAGLTVLCGCQDPLFPKDSPRSQYARYETLRGRERPEKQLNTFGREEPALRERLSPLGREWDY
jgi:hypothetical protein